jgi:hypothetical protein
MRKRSETSKPGSPGDSKAASKTSWTADLDPDFLARLRELDKEERKKIGALITAACESFGHPHLHAGSGLRALGHSFYECRYGLKLRLIFQRVNDQSLYFHMLGTHDEVKRFLRGMS